MSVTEPASDHRQRAAFDEFVVPEIPVLYRVALSPTRRPADTLGVPRGTVMSRLHRARARIRTRLTAAGLAPQKRLM